MSNEQETETIDRTHEAVLDKLQAEISELLPKCDDKAAAAIREKADAISWSVIRIGWLLSDVKRQLKLDGTIVYEEWIKANFKKKLPIERANQFVKISRDYQVDNEYKALRDSFGLDPLLVEATSDISLEDQLAEKAASGGYAKTLKGVGVLPTKQQEPSNGDEPKIAKSPEQKVIHSLRRSFNTYLKFRGELGDAWISVDPVIDQLQTILRSIAPQESPELIQQESA